MTEQNKAPPHDIHRLIEECSEVQKVACKALRFGEQYKNPTTGLTNWLELKAECADLVEVIAQIFDIDDKQFLILRDMKKQKIEAWKSKELS